MCVYETNNKLQRVINNGERAEKSELFRVYPQELSLFTGNVKSDVANANQIINNTINNNSAHGYVSAFK